MSPMDKIDLFQDETSGVDAEGVRHWHRIQVTEWWEAVDERGNVATTAATREAVIASYNDSYKFLMEQTKKYDIDWDSEEHGRSGPPLPLLGVRRVLRREVNSAWEDRSQLMDERGSYGFQPCDGCARTPEECARVCSQMQGDGA